MRVKFYIISIIMYAGITSGTILAEETQFGINLQGLPSENTEYLKKIDKNRYHPQYANFFVAWQKNNTISFAREIKTLNDNNLKTIITWEPFTLNSNVKVNILYNQLSLGLYDNYIKQVAQDIKSSNTPVIIRLMHEMNIPDYHWGTKDTFNHEAPDIYIKMYRYIVDTFRKEYSEHVQWAFCPNHESVPRGDWNKIENFYPGDSYVDLLGLDAYNWGNTRNEQVHKWNSSWKTLKELIDHPVSTLREIAPKKHMLIFETATVGSNDEKKKWLQDAISYANQSEISALLYFDIKKEEDWRLPVE